LMLCPLAPDESCNLTLSARQASRASHLSLVAVESGLRLRSRPPEAQLGDRIQLAVSGGLSAWPRAKKKRADEIEASQKTRGAKGL
jgi:hypothetical protein